MSPSLKIAPSLLAADFANLAAEIHKVESAGCDMLHIDVMDGHFVPNITVGPFIVKAIRSITSLPLDTHLMIDSPEKYIQDFAKAGSDSITVHIEACNGNLAEVLKQMRACNVRCGVSLKPATPLSGIEKYLKDIDMVLLMTVNPGFGGQSFMREVLPKITALRKNYIKDIQVDGGINKETSREAVSAGANVLVAGTAIFGKSGHTTGDRGFKMSEIKFGTDGWRALMDKDFTFENVERVAQAFADYLKEASPRSNGDSPARVVIGYDTRKNSENFARSFAEVLVANNVGVLLTNSACPTPAVSFTIVKEKFDRGIAITASHNPPGYNGIKIKTDFGGSADKGITDRVESLIGKNPVKKKAFSAANPQIRDLNEKYLQFLKNYIRLDLVKESPYRVLVDSMHGTGAKHIEEMLAGGNIKITTIRDERDVNFGGISPEPIPKFLGTTMEKMKSGPYDLCVVTDGDADRVGAIRPGGEFISPGIILSLIMLHFVQDLGRKGSVVTTISNTALIYRMAQKLGLQVHETPVGFKYICEIMRKENVLIGGEESGGIGFQNYLYERDGMLSGFLLMEMMAMRKQSFDEILKSVEKEFGKLYYVRKDLNYPNELKPKLFEFLSQNPPKKFAQHAVNEIKKQDGVKFILDDGSWLLFRLSGTEPILRIYSEATSLPLAESLVEQGKELAFNLS